MRYPILTYTVYIHTQTQYVIKNVLNTIYISQAHRIHDCLIRSISHARAQVS